jgi:hypothetical protein
MHRCQQTQTLGLSKLEDPICTLLARETPVKPVVPQGYRQGFITSITVTLTASILFLRFVFFEPQSGEWTNLGLLIGAVLLLSIALQFFALFRALRPKDEQLGVYTRTLVIFGASIVVLVGSFSVNIYISAGPAFREWLYGLDSKAAYNEFYQGLKYETGQGVTQDIIEAAEWYRRAAERGLVASQIKLGTMYERGRGVPQDYALAYMWFNAAAMSGDPDATKVRDELSSKLSGEQIVEGQRLSRDNIKRLQ